MHVAAIASVSHRCHRMHTRLSGGWGGSHSHEVRWSQKNAHLHTVITKLAEPIRDKTRRILAAKQNTLMLTTTHHTAAKRSQHPVWRGAPSPSPPYIAFRASKATDPSSSSNAPLSCIHRVKLQVVAAARPQSQSHSHVALLPP